MTDEVPGSLSLDEDAPPLDQQMGTETPPPEPDAEPEPEGTVEIPTGKVVPLQALQAERHAKKQEREARERLEQEVVGLRDKAGKLDQIAGEWQAVQPLIQQIQRGEYQKAAPKASAGPLSDAEAVEYAKDLDLYKVDGTPDTDRAQRLAARNQKLVEHQTQQALAPFAQQTATQQSRSLFEQAATMKDPSGATVDKNILQQFWQMVPAELSAQPQVATILHRVAVAESLIQGKYKGLTTPPPVVETASLGGGGAPKDSLTAVDRRFLEASDMKSDEYTKIGSRFKPGQHNVLE